MHTQIIETKKNDWFGTFMQMKHCGGLRLRL